VTARADARQTWWEDEGERTAERLRDVSAVLVVGASPEEAARVAVGIARAESERRHVALGDLVGDLAPLYAMTGGEDAFGLTDCLRHGLPLNDIARPAPDRASLFILPAGSPPVSTPEIIAHERWQRLVNGFTEMGALLILVAPLHARGIEKLAAATGGVVLVRTAAAAAEAKRFRVLATVAGPGREPAQPPPARIERARWPRGALFAVLVVIAVLGIAGGLLAWRRHASARPAPVAERAPKREAAPPLARPASETVRLADPVNPVDTASTVPFAIEVMAANTLAGANSFLANNGQSTALSGATVSPVVVGGSTSVWYKVVAGASHVRAGADSLLAALRRERAVRSGEGRVVTVPYALVLARRVMRTEVAALVRSWRQRGFDAYALVQDDGSVSLLAGAFETPAQAAPLASALRADGVAPVLVYRTGRAY
jgi:hypothetical protein